jgi:Carboxypeptidase regulatory-like domain
MKKRLESKLNMYDAVITFCNNNALVAATVPAFQNALTDFIAKVDVIRETTQMAADAIKGVTEDKAKLKKGLCSQGTTIAAAVFAYAISEGDNTLMEKVRYTKSKLSRQKSEMLGPVCSNIYDAANANVPALVGYGITPATLTGFKTDIDNYIACVPTPRNAVSQRSVFNDALKQLFKEADHILKPVMDKTALQFKKPNPDFYANYLKNRMIVDAGGIATKIKGKVVAATDNAPLYGASVQLVGEELTATTDLQGNFILKPMQPGVYNIKISKPGFEDQTLENLQVKLGKATTAEIQMNLPIAG